MYSYIHVSKIFTVEDTSTKSTGIVILENLALLLSVAVSFEGFHGADLDK